MVAELDNADKPGTAKEEILVEKAALHDVSSDPTLGLVNLWKDRAAAGDDHCRYYHWQCKEIMAFYLGRQYLANMSSYEMMSGGYKLRDRPQLHPWEVRVTVNKLAMNIDSYAARLLSDHPLPIAQASVESEKGWKAAAVANQFLRFRAAQWDAQTHFQRMAVGVTACGLGWIYDSYDPDAVAEFRDPETGDLRRDKIGNIRTELGKAWDVVWEPGTSVRTSSWYVRRRLMRLRDIREKWGKRGELVIGENIDEFSAADNLEYTSLNDSLLSTIDFYVGLL